MRKFLIGLCILLSGCAAPLVYAPVPEGTLALEGAVRASGVWQPRGMYFTLISRYEGESARAVFLAEPALKLADLTVSPSEVRVHYKAEQVPDNLVRAWGKLVQDNLLTQCPPRQIAARAAGISGNFELAVTGGVCR